MFGECRGFVPERRGPFVSAKVTKTIDAPSGLIRGEGRQPWVERPNSPGSNKGRSMRRASLPGASRQASDLGEECVRGFHEREQTMGMTKTMKMGAR
ncbi:MAG: hypothetical protein NPIRA06_01440 [Nitrospirales bacterium]|nr:MAG: hypothetical protein NPIRA06_01440 [Nitrospirales bacterium]